MDEYIKREAAIEGAKTADLYILDEYEVIKAIKAIPAADVRPVVRGRWVARPYMMGNTQYCSRCDENYGAKYHFCPNCGADMREES